MDGPCLTFEIEKGAELSDETAAAAHCMDSKLRDLAAAGAYSRLGQLCLIGIACAGMRPLLLQDEIKVE